MFSQLKAVPYDFEQQYAFRVLYVQNHRDSARFSVVKTGMYEYNYSHTAVFSQLKAVPYDFEQQYAFRALYAQNHRDSARFSFVKTGMYEYNYSHTDLFSHKILNPYGLSNMKQQFTTLLMICLGAAVST